MRYKGKNGTIRMKWFIRISAVLLVVGSLSLMVSTLMFPSATLFVSNAIESVSGTKTVYSELTTKIKTQDDKIQMLLKKQALASSAVKQIAAINSTSKRILNRSVIRASRNVGSLAVKLIPQFGVATVISIALLDLKDSCNTIKDLETLSETLGLSVEDELKEMELCGLTKEELLEIVGENSEDAWNATKKFIPDLPDWEKTKELMQDLPDFLPELEWIDPVEWQNWFKGEPDN